MDNTAALLAFPFNVVVHGCLEYMWLWGTAVPTMVPPAVAPAMDSAEHCGKGAAAHGCEHGNLGVILEGQVGGACSCVCHEQALTKVPHANVPAAACIVFY